MKTTRKYKFRPSFEALEDRQLMAAGIPGVTVGDRYGRTGLLIRSPNGAPLNASVTGTASGSVGGMATYTLRVTVNGQSETYTGIHVVDFGGTSGNDYCKINSAVPSWLEGRQGSDTLIGGTGNDTISGAVGSVDPSGSDVLQGGDGNDWILAGVGNDTIDGGRGDDTITDYGGSDLITGGEGRDYISDDQATRVGHGGITRTERLAAIGTDVIDAGTEDDLIEYNAGNDTFTGGAGDDTFEIMQEYYESTGAGKLTLNDSIGLNTLDLTDLWTYYNGVTLYLGETHHQQLNTFRTIQFATTTTIANVIGTQKDDRIVGNSLANRLVGWRGNDTLEGGAGDDTLCGGQGNDTYVYYGSRHGTDRIEPSGFAFIRGEENHGSDTIDFRDARYGIDIDLYRTGRQTVSSGNLSLTLAYDAAVDHVVGSNYDDYIRGNTRANKLSGLGGADSLYGRDGNDDLNGGAGNDFLVGGIGDDTISFTDLAGGTDTIDGDEGINWLNFRNYLSAVTVDLSRRGTQSVNAAHLKLNLRSTAAIDHIWGSFYHDILKGNSNANDLYGWEGDDTLYGRGGKDRLYGGNGNDGLYGGTDADLLVGHRGKDRFLTTGTQDRIEDLMSWDAEVQFARGARQWLTSEIEQVDAGLALLHRATGNTVLLKDPTWGTLRFVRQGHNSTQSANNPLGSRDINVFNATFASAEWAKETIVHEIMHCWHSVPLGHASENAVTNLWHSFIAISGWTRQNLGAGYTRVSSYDGVWYYRSNAEFASRNNGYARLTPYEDMTTSVEVYFFGSDAEKAEIPRKLTVIEVFMNHISNLD